MYSFARTLRASLLVALASLTWASGPAQAADRLCDPGGEDCRAILINLIRNERAGIDVAFWFMEDSRYTTELIARWNAGVPVRVLVDTRANAKYPLNATRIQELVNAGIPIRRASSSRNLHWKMMLFSGQNIVEFSGANYSPDAWRPGTTTPYENYTDESILFSDQASIVNSFRTRFDNAWVHTSDFANYANITTPLTRTYDIYSKDAELSFPPFESTRSRTVAAICAETGAIDIIMYRITDGTYANEIIAAAKRIPVRLITEPKTYRDKTQLWHAYYIDKLYMAGVKIKQRAHAGLNHQKSAIMRNQRMAIFGSSNWTPWDVSQYQHDMFTKQSDIYTWFDDQFDRKWNNTGGVIENTTFVPLAPAAAISPSPVNGATGVSTSVTLKWWGGSWAHIYDVYFGTSSNPPLVAANLTLGPSESTTDFQSYTIPTTLQSGTRYYWRIVSKTMANKTKPSATWSFTTGGTGTLPPPPDPADGDIVLYAADASIRVGAWSVVSDSTAAGGKRVWYPNAGAAKRTAASATPNNYIELTFSPKTGTAYRIWMRGKAESNYWGNDSVFIQFSGSVNSSGSAIWRIGTTTAADWNLEDCSGCGLSGWGWQDNGWGVGVLGPLVYFNSTTQKIRIQIREDGLSLDQIVLSPSTYKSAAPGALKNDTTILPRSSGG
jgi:phage gp37-like protein